MAYIQAFDKYGVMLGEIPVPGRSKRRSVSVRSSKKSYQKLGATRFQKVKFLAG